MALREYKDCLTNEQLLKRFKNQFELVRYAIEIATGEIRSGNDSFGPNQSDNVAYQALADIACGSEILREAVKIEPIVIAKKDEKKEKKSKSKALR